MKEYSCTALIRYSKQEVEVHINALKIALQSKELQNYRGPYLSLLKDMQRIKDQMIDKENGAMAEAVSDKEMMVEGSVINDA